MTTDTPLQSRELDFADRAMDGIEPHEIPKTGDDKPASSLWSYVIRMSGRHQIFACMIAVLVALLNIVPVELQRRIVDDALMTQSYESLLFLGGLYAGVIVLHQIVKFGMRIYQGWISESAILYTRRHLLDLYGRGLKCGDENENGTAVAVLSTETDKLGGFVGEGIVQAVTNVALLIGAIAYMVIVEAKIALFGLAFMIPQIILTPLLQRKLNQLVEIRVDLMRGLSTRISAMDGEMAEECRAILPDIYRNRLRFFFVKFGIKALLNLLNAAAPLVVLIYGGMLVIEGETTVGVIVAFIAGFSRISEPLRELIAFYRLAAQADVQHRKIADWMQGKNRRNC